MHDIFQPLLANTPLSVWYSVILATPPSPPAQAGAFARASYNILSRYVGSRLCNTTVSARPGGHHRQMEAQSRVSRLMGYACSHPIPLGLESVMGLRALPGVLHALKIIN